MPGWCGGECKRVKRGGKNCPKVQLFAQIIWQTFLAETHFVALRESFFSKLHMNVRP